MPRKWGTPKGYRSSPCSEQLTAAGLQCLPVIAEEIINVNIQFYRDSFLILFNFCRKLASYIGFMCQKLSSITVYILKLKRGDLEKDFRVILFSESYDCSRWFITLVCYCQNMFILEHNCHQLGISSHCAGLRSDGLSGIEGQ